MVGVGFLVVACLLIIDSNSWNRALNAESIADVSPDFVDVVCMVPSVGQSLSP
jgi:hypothetical protein